MSESQLGLDLLSRISERAFLEKPEILGIENLDNLPINQPLVVATTHFSDQDVQTVAAEVGPEIRNRRPGHKIGIAWEYPPTHQGLELLTRIVGARKYLFDVDAPFNQKKNRLAFKFNPENFQRMVEAMSNTDMIIAAHEPLSNIKGKGFRWELPRRSGLGAVYLAQRSGGIVLPVAVDIQSELPTGLSVDVKKAVQALIERKPKVKIIVGKLIHLEPIDHKVLDAFDEYIYSKTTRDQVENGRSAYLGLRAQANSLMHVLAGMLPESKRGKW